MRYKLVATILLSSVTTACGGGGGSDPIVVNPGPTPVPAPTPTPSPTPTPPPGPITGEIKPSASSQSVASVQNVTIDAVAKRTSDRSVSASGNSFDIRYDDATRTYRVQNELLIQNFGRPDLLQEINIPDEYPRVEWQRSSASSTDLLTIYKSISLGTNAEPAVPIVYTAHGSWKQSRRLQGNADRVRFDYFVYGQPTPPASVPRAGVATYRSRGNGHWAEDGGFYFARVNSEVRVDFSTGIVEFRLDAGGNDIFNGGFGGLIGFTARTTVTGNGFEGLASFAQATYAGSYRALFFGPNADEIGVVFSGAGERASFNGAFVGTRN